LLSLDMYNLMITTSDFVHTVTYTNRTGLSEI
jgi:hypothetical protein